MIRILIFCITALAIAATGFAQPGEFSRALPGYHYEYPRDHGVHPDFRTEWWYFTGNLEGDEGQAFGYELTFFRVGLIPPGGHRPASPLAAHTAYFAHFAVSHISRREHRFWERMGRPGFGQAEYSTATLSLRLHDWTASTDGDGSIALAASTDGAEIHLDLSPAKPVVIHGKEGVHQKADDPGQASHYVSFTRMTTVGSLRWGDEDTTVSGLSWMDHEFGSDQLAPDQIGWHWFALQMDNGWELMLYQILRRDGTFHAAQGSLIQPDGTCTPLAGGGFTVAETHYWRSPRTGAKYPVAWRIGVPELGVTLDVRAAFPEQEMRTIRTAGGAYWEGAIRVKGEWQGERLKGSGYVELVGHAGEFSGL